jgi:hypothetical protein
MQMIEARVSIDEDRKLMIQLPSNLPIGGYEMVLFLNQLSQAATSSNQNAIEEIQSLSRRWIESDRSLSDELIQERREESRNE